MGAADNDFTHSDGVSLRDLFCSTCTAHREGCEKALDVRFAAMDKALGLHEQVENEKFSKTNEWRKTIDDITQLKLDRSEYIWAHQLLIDKVESGDKGKLSWQSAILLAFLFSSLSSMIVLVLTHFLK